MRRILTSFDSLTEFERQRVKRIGINPNGKVEMIISIAAAYRSPFGEADIRKVFSDAALQRALR
jgi:hypothetical protein